MSQRPILIALGLLGALGLGSVVLSSSSAKADAYPAQCLQNICVGDLVDVVGGQWVGHAGSVVGVDPYANVVTVINNSGYYLYPSFYEVRERYQGGGSRCVANLCVNDTVSVVSGIHRGRYGRVVGVDANFYSATIITPEGQYLVVDLRDVVELRDPRPYPIPQPRPIPVERCPVGYVWDAYRGCVRVVVYPQPVPRPVPRPIPGPGPRPVPRPVPQPRPIPQPRPAPGPVVTCPPGTRPVPVPGGMRCGR